MFSSVIVLLSATSHEESCMSFLHVIALLYLSLKISNLIPSLSCKFFPMELNIDIFLGIVSKFKILVS